VAVRFSPLPPGEGQGEGDDMAPIVVLKIKREMKQWSSVFDKNQKVHTVFVFLHAMGATVSQLY
jgi:hypothetical protein